MKLRRILTAAVAIVPLVTFADCGDDVVVGEPDGSSQTTTKEPGTAPQAGGLQIVLMQAAGN